jgi:4-amino-4-deoxy-L-arabinose transferase-like glycosyltransferase
MKGRIAARLAGRMAAMTTLYDRTAVSVRSRPTIVEWAGIAALVVATAMTLYWRWVGFQGHDDTSYAAAALSWVERFPPLGTDHWSLRYPLVLPAAGLFALFGPSVMALVATNLVAYVAFLVICYVAARHWFGWVTALALTTIGVVLPQFPVQATYANPDLLEMTLVVASFWTLIWARQHGGTIGALLLAGVLAGFGFLTRETSVLLVILYGLLFLFRPAMPRGRYLFVGLGFLLVVGAQAGYFAARTGDPLYRTRISATHDAVDRGSKLTEAQTAGRALDSEGVLATSPLVAPFAAVFVSQKYGLLFLLAIPAYVILRRERWMTPSQTSVVDCAGLGAVVAFLFVAVNGEVLYIVPRYFMVPAALAAVPPAVLVARWLAVGGLRRLAAGVVGAGFVASCLMLLYLENVRPLLSGEQIVAFISGTQGTVYLDPETLREVHFLLVINRLQQRISAEAPPPGALVGSIDGVVQGCLHESSCTYKERMQRYVPRSDWTLVERFDPPRRWIAGLIELTGIGKHIPADIVRKIGQPGNGGAVWRVPG